MTTPDQRLRAIFQVRQFLFDLIDPKKTPKVPGPIRKRARELAKHYPDRSDGDLLQKQPFLQ